MKLLQPSGFTAKAKLLLNGQVFNLNGDGTLEFPGGIVLGDYEIDENRDHVDPYIFKAILITGYPSVCCINNDILNPFQTGDYNYQREIDFGKYGRISYTADCTHREQDGKLFLDSVFDVTGKVSVPTLEKAYPVVETWVPDGDTINASFLISWKQANSDKYVIGRANTVYNIPKGSTNIPHTIHRAIRFVKASKRHTSLHVVQESRLKLNLFTN